MDTPILQIPLADQTLRRPSILVPRALADIAPVLLVEDVEVRPVRADIRIRADRQRGGSERAAGHGGVDAVCTAVDDCAPGAYAGGAGCEGGYGFDIGVWLLVDEETEGVG